VSIREAENGEGARRALDVAHQALARIESHERTFATLSEYQRRELEALKATVQDVHRSMDDGFDKLYGRWWATSTAVILGLLALIGYLLVEGVPWTAHAAARAPTSHASP